ncbi:MAG: DUF4160 domain-containing protein, partial [Ferrovum sp.]|nr:DUF4160 domain-containing protein [Ferrovum sp.]
HVPPHFHATYGEYKATVNIRELCISEGELPRRALAVLRLLINTDHADHNAAKVIAMRGVRQLLSGKGVQKEKKRCMITRIKVGAEGPRTGCEESQSTLGETVVSRGGGNTLALWSLTQEETHTTTRLCA